MWIFLGILGALLSILIVLLLLPVKLVIKFDKENKFNFWVKFLWLQFDLNDTDKSDSSLFKKFKAKSGIENAEAKTKQNKAKDFIDKLSDNFSLISSLLQSLYALLKKCTVQKLKLKVVCAEDDAAKTAISYGRAYALFSPFVAFVHSLMKIKKKGKQLFITCDYESKENVFELYMVISTPVFRILIALLTIALDQSKNNDAKKEG